MSTKLVPMRKAVIITLSLLAEILCASAYGTSPLQNDKINRAIEISNQIISQRADGTKTDSLTAVAPVLSIDDAIAVVSSEMDERQIAKIVDAIYLINNLRHGNTLDASRDAISFTSLFPFRKPNSLDIAKLKDVFTSDSPVLHKTYLNKFPFLFRNCGPMPELLNLRGIIEANVTECDEKNAALTLFDSYATLMPGATAPQLDLYDKDGNKHQFNDYLGKTVVVDVWATWCTNCLKRMPAMKKLHDSYAEKENVVFLNVSIDRRDKHEAWNRISEKHSLTGEHNLIVNSDDKSDFEDIYKIFGIPRYIVIRPDGRLADAFAPGPGEDLKNLIDSTL